jgi:hypothetical protein
MGGYCFSFRELGKGEGRASWEGMSSMPWLHEYLSFGDYPAAPDIVKTLFTCK